MDFSISLYSDKTVINKARYRHVKISEGLVQIRVYLLPVCLRDAEQFMDKFLHLDLQTK